MFSLISNRRVRQTNTPETDPRSRLSCRIVASRLKWNDERQSLRNIASPRGKRGLNSSPCGETKNAAAESGRRFIIVNGSDSERKSCG